MTELADIKSRRLSTLVCSHFICQACGVIDRHNEYAHPVLGNDALDRSIPGDCQVAIGVSHRRQGLSSGHAALKPAVQLLGFLEVEQGEGQLLQPLQGEGLNPCPTGGIQGAEEPFQLTQGQGKGFSVATL